MKKYQVSYHDHTKLEAEEVECDLYDHDPGTGFMQFIQTKEDLRDSRVVLSVPSISVARIKLIED